MEKKISKNKYWIENFDPLQVLSCGQAFHWDMEEDGSFTTVHKDQWANVKKEGKNISWIFSEKDRKEEWFSYFDLQTDYKGIIERIDTIPLMKEATEYGKGIRILKQDPFETIITFIISANNHIPRITKAVKDLSRIYGKEIGEYNGRALYSFPNPGEFSKASQEELRNIIKVGYRDKVLIETGKRILSGEFDLSKAGSLSTEDLRKELLDLPGVGPKVADCILLFAYQRMEVFPVDVWIHRVMEEYIFGEKGSKKEIHRKSVELFGKEAGYAQQYLFYYGRAKGIGKKEKKPR